MKEYLTVAAKIVAEMSRSCSSSRNQGERAGHHHGRGVGRLWGRRLPPPRSPTAPGGTGFSTPCPPPPGARRPCRRPRGLPLLEEQPQPGGVRGRERRGGGWKEREARVRFAGNFSETTT